MNLRFSLKQERVLVAFAACVLASLYLFTRPTLTWPHLVGHKTSSFFDLWSIQHFLSGSVLGMMLTSKNRPVYVWRLLAIALTWECFEWSCEAGVFGQPIAHWLCGEEHWSNRLIADPLLYLVGAHFGVRRPELRRLVSFLIIVWFTANLLEPTSMDIQERLFQLLAASLRTHHVGSFLY